MPSHARSPGRLAQALAPRAAIGGPIRTSQPAHRQDKKPANLVSEGATREREVSIIGEARRGSQSLQRSHQAAASPDLGRIGKQCRSTDCLKLWRRVLQGVAVLRHRRQHHGRHNLIVGLATTLQCMR